MADYILCTPTATLESLATEARARFVARKAEQHAEYVRRTIVPDVLAAMRAREVTAHQLALMSAFTEPLFWDHDASRVIKAERPDLAAIALRNPQGWNSLHKFLSGEGEGIVRRDQLNEFREVVRRCLDRVLGAIREQLLGAGWSTTKVAAWEERAGLEVPWTEARCVVGTEAHVRIGEFLVVVVSALDQVAESDRDLIIYSLAGTNFPLKADYLRLIEAFRTQDEGYLRWKVEEEIERDMAVVLPAAEKELASLNDLRVIIKTAPKSSVELQEDEELLGHYLAMQIGLDIPASRRSGDLIQFELTPEQFGRLQEALAAVSKGSFDSNAVGDLAEEFGFSEEMAEGVLSWFSGSKKDEFVRKRKKLEKFVAEALAGKKKLLFVHVEG